MATAKKSKDIEAARRQQLNSNNADSKTILAQQEEQQQLNNNSDTPTEKQLKMSYCLPKRWLIILSMTLVLIITAILVAMLTISMLDNEDHCFNQFPFQQSSYKLFSTKTAYSVAYQYLNDSRNYLSGQHYSGADNRDLLELPNIFSKSDSLAALDQRLSSQEFGCKVRQFHYFGRHAARFPSSNGIEEINKHLNNVQTRIDLSKYQHSLQNTNNNNHINSNSQEGNKTATTTVCFNPLAPYKQWVSLMSPEQGNLVLDSGMKETELLALRLKSIYPDLFDAVKSKIEIGTTDEIRTAQTAIAFIRAFDNYSLGFCDLEQLPQQNSFDKSKAYELTNNECFRTMLSKFSLDKLQFHKKCESYHREDYQIVYNLKLNVANRTQFIANSVSKKLKLNSKSNQDEQQLTTDETEAIYKVCKYETALIGSSIWCNLFTDSDLKFYEYMEDVDDFYNKAYGHPDQMRSACPVTSELMKAFKTARAASQHQDPSLRGKPEAYFYFTHSQVIQKILAASVELEQDPAYSPKTIQAHLNAGTAPKSRQWRSSLFTPFSANLAFTLYECPKSTKGLSSSAPPSGSIDFDVNESPFKVVASLNEQPIQLDGCTSRVCDLNELTSDGRLDREKRCKLEDICRRNIVVT